MIANPSLEMVLIRRRGFDTDSKGIIVVAQAILRYNQTSTQESLEDYPSIKPSRNHYGREGRALCSLALDLFRKSTGVPSLEICLWRLL